MNARALGLGAALVALAALAVPSLGGAQEARKTGGTLRAVFVTDPPTLDPAEATDLTSAAVIRQVFDALLELDDRLRPIPALAESWTVSTDQRVYTFRLRSGVRFHNGRELRAADVKHSFERAARGKRPWVFEKITGARDVIAGRKTEIAGLRALDDLSVEVRLDRPFPPFLYLMAYDAASVVPREEAD
jgi:ABC-type transport system substrate-binding protein